MRINKTEPTVPTKGRIYHSTKYTSYGRVVEGSKGNKDFAVYIAENPVGNILHKLYYISQNYNWRKSRLVFFKDNRIDKIVSSSAKNKLNEII